jgi:nucleotide-binding universal stress UspA family protein
VTGAGRDAAVVVGVDASEVAFRAARFAAEEAVRRRVALRIVHAITVFDGLSHPYPELDAPALVDLGAQSLLQAVADHVADILPADRVTASAEHGRPADVLTTASLTASLVVVGGRGIGGLTGLLLGSTAHAVVAQAACPVVVVPVDPGARTRQPRSVVVGVEGRGDEEVLAFAFAEASARGTELVAVHAWQDVVLETAYRSISPLVDWDGVMADEERVLAEALSGWRDKEPDVAVREIVLRERTARALVEASLAAELLVVGRRPRRWLGPTVHGALHRAACPVAVVPLGDESRSDASVAAH